MKTFLILLFVISPSLLWAQKTPVYYLIIKNTEIYDSALQTAMQATKLLELEYREIEEASWCEEVGLDKYSIYFSSCYERRGRTQGKYITIEYSESEKYDVVVATSLKEFQPSFLNRIKEYYPNAIQTKEIVWMGCNN